MTPLETQITVWLSLSAKGLVCGILPAAIYFRAQKRMGRATGKDAAPSQMGEKGGVFFPGRLPFGSGVFAAKGRFLRFRLDSRECGSRHLFGECDLYID